MRLRYCLWDPTGNLTLFVEEAVPRGQHASLAARLMARLPRVEQVGFLEPPALPGAKLRLEMMGGEFCGNASLSAAAYLAERDGLPDGPVPLEVSGYPGLLTVDLVREGGGFRGTVAMPLPERIGEAELPGAGIVPAVAFSGITHCLVPADALTPAAAQTAIRPLCAALGADACGILLLSPDAAALTPLVRVARTDTAVWESGCGSGAAAVGAYLAARAQKSVRVSPRQPGGTIAVSAGWADGRVCALSITGSVRLLERGILEL